MSNTEKLPSTEQRWQARTVGNTGFEYGLDSVTPVSWKIVRSRSVGNAAYSFSLPEPNNDGYRDWLKENRGKVMVASVAELRRTVASFGVM